MAEVSASPLSQRPPSGLTPWPKRLPFGRGWVLPSVGPSCALPGRVFSGTSASPSVGTALARGLPRRAACACWWGMGCERKQAPVRKGGDVHANGTNRLPRPCLEGPGVLEDLVSQGVVAWGSGGRVPALPLTATACHGAFGSLGMGPEEGAAEAPRGLCASGPLPHGVVFRAVQATVTQSCVTAQLGEGRANPPPLPCSSGPGAPCPWHLVKPTGLLFPLRPYLPSTPDQRPSGNTGVGL